MSSKSAPIQSTLPGLADVGLDTRGFKLVSYERLYNIGGYENLRIGAAVTVLPDEMPSDALARARAWVDAQKPPR